MNKALLIALCLAVSTSLFAQVGINPTGSAPASDAALDVDFPGKGMLIPRMSEAVRDTISSPSLGLMIFNTTSGCVNMWTGATWKQSCFDCSFPAPTLGNNGPICEGQTLNLTASSIPGATYSWTGPNGFSSSQQNPSISNASTSANGIYSLQVTLNGCTGNPISTTATVSAVPTTPVISTNSPVCVGGTLTLSATSSGGASFSWAGPNGYSANGGSQTITPVVINNAGSYTVTADVNGCTSSNSTTIVVNDVPAAPSVINGDSTPCSNTANVVYSTPAVGGATSYTWTVPAGASITNGQGTTSITVDFGAISGNICVSANNACGAGTQTCEAVTLGGAGAGSQTFSHTGGEQTFTVPPCVTSITLEAWGAQGGDGYPGASTPDDGGRGGYATGTLAVTPGQVLYVNVGGEGALPTNYNTAGGLNAGGYNGGGNGYSGGGGGGGASHVASTSGVLSAQTPGNVFIVAGGGGGGVRTGCSIPGDAAQGGAGGGLTGAPTPTNACGSTPGAPGTQTVGGSPFGSFGQGGNYDPVQNNDLAGGGGGWYGGGSGSVNQVGGGGSSYIGNASLTGGSTTNGNSSMPNPSGGTMTGNTGNGVVKISW